MIRYLFTIGLVVLFTTPITASVKADLWACSVSPFETSPKTSDSTDECCCHMTIESSQQDSCQQSCPCHLEGQQSPIHQAIDQGAIERLDESNTFVFGGAHTIPNRLTDIRASKTPDYRIRTSPTQTVYVLTQSYRC